MPLQFIPRDCTSCGQPLQPRKSIKGLCRPCWRAANRDALCAYMRRYHAEHRSEEREADHRRYAEDREQQIARVRQWQRAHPDAKRAADARYYRRHAEALIAKVRAYNPPPDVRLRLLITKRERQFRRNATIYRGHVDHRAVFERDGGRCHLCGQTVAFEAMSLDHIVPLALGGAHSFENVRCAHRLCNTRRQHRGAAQPFLL